MDQDHIFFLKIKIRLDLMCSHGLFYNKVLMKAIFCTSKYFPFLLRYHEFTVDGKHVYQNQTAKDVD